MQAIISALEDYKTANGSYPSTVQGLAALANPSLAAADPWGNAWIYKCPGVFTDYELSSLGADNKSGGEGLDADITSWAPSSLIAEWFEYTPSKGVDIQLNTAPALMA
jgi:general secretion pathway protein G